MNSNMNFSHEEKVHVRIGRKYEAAFRSICDLVSKKIIDGSIVQSCTKDQIETAQYIFEYTGEAVAIDTGTQIGMLPSGATWFRAFRNDESNSAIGAWHSLIEAVATDYHKKYSLVEYIQNDSARKEDGSLESYRQMIRRMAEVLRFPPTRVVEATGDDCVEDIYAVSLRLELYGGAGEPRPVLCKVYFRNRSNVFFALEKEEAGIVEQYVCDLVGNRNAGGAHQERENETEIVDHVLNALSKLTRNELPNSFTDCILVTNETDSKTINELVRVEPQDEVCLVCKRLKVLGIIHLRWKNAAFHIYVGKRRAFLAKLGITKTISLYCCCNSEDSKLIENNTIFLNSGERIRIQPEEDDLGLTAEEVEQIRGESAFANHFFQISCPELTRRNISCSQFRCTSNTHAFDVDGVIKVKCTDCPYPEVVFRLPDGITLSYTPSLGFDTKTMLATSGFTATCTFCKRSYAVEEQTSSKSEYFCTFCKESFDKLEKGGITQADVRTYKRYAGMIPLGGRFKAMFKKKYCFENQDRLLFVVGKKKFFFDKLKLDDAGLLENPEKRQ